VTNNLLLHHHLHHTISLHFHTKNWAIGSCPPAVSQHSTVPTFVPTPNGALQTNLGTGYSKTEHLLRFLLIRPELLVQLPLILIICCIKENCLILRTILNRRLVVLRLHHAVYRQHTLVLQ